jgi:hypothetical protein
MTLINMSREVISQLKALKHADINPSQEWLQNSRALLMSQIKNTIHSEKPSFITSFTNRVQEVFLHSSSRFVRVGAMVVLVAIVMATGRVATTQAEQALPGDTLYGLKRTAEKTQVAVVSVVADEKQLVKLHLELADRRADEIKQVVKKNPERKEATKAAVQDLKEELKTANKKLEDIKKQTPNEVKTTVTDVQQKTESIQTALREVKTDLQSSTTTVDKNLSQEIASAKDLTQQTNVAVVQVAVESHLKGGDVSKEDVTKVVDQTLHSVAADIDKSKQTVADVKTSLAQIASSTPTSTLTSTTTSTTTVVQEKIKTVSNETAEAVKQTEAAKQQMDQKTNEVKELVAKGGNLNQVVDKVKEVTTVSKEAEKVSDQTVQKVQTLIPEIQTMKANEAVSTSVSNTSGSSTSSISTSSRAVPLLPSSSTASTSVRSNSTTLNNVR